MVCISDIHFGATLSAHISRFIETACDPRLNADAIVIIAGDMTQHASESEYREAQRLLRTLLDAGIRVVLTPGNHDFGNWIGEYIRINRNARKRYRSLMEPVFDQREIVAVEDYDSIMRCGNNIFVSLRSTHRGKAHSLGIVGINRIRKRQVQWAASRLAAMHREGALLHLVTHRSLWRESGDRHKGIYRPAFIERHLLERFSFHSIIHGHNHRYLFACTSTPRLGIPIIRLSLPTISDRNRKNRIGFVRWEQPYRGIPEFVAL
ncbi:MAG: metallophosphoesterase [Spirochaetes bacterium]|nr:metallophosphoesterase [Spirochaetota bacterium]